MLKKLSSTTLIVLSLWGSAFLFTDWYEKYHGDSIPVIESRLEKKTSMVVARLLESRRFKVLASVKTHTVHESSEQFNQDPDRIILKESSTVDNEEESNALKPSIKTVNNTLSKSSPGFSGVLQHTRDIKLEDEKTRTEQ